MGRLGPIPTVMRTCDAEGFGYAAQKDPELMVGRLDIHYLRMSCTR